MKSTTARPASLTWTSLWAASILHYRAYSTTIHRDSEGDSFSILIIIRQVSLCYSLLSVTWPFSRSFMKSFDTRGLIMSMTGTDTGGGSGPASALRSWQNKQLETIKSATSSSKIRMMSDHVTHSTSLYYESDISREDRRFGSQEMIIRRDDTVTVTYDAR